MRERISCGFEGSSQSFEHSMRQIRDSAYAGQAAFGINGTPKNHNLAKSLTPAKSIDNRWPAVDRPSVLIFGLFLLKSAYRSAVSSGEL